MSEYAKALTDFWSAQGQAMLRAQEQASSALTEGMQALMSGKFPSTPSGSSDGIPGMADLAKASEGVAQLWSAAASLSSELGNKLAKFGGADEQSPVFAVLSRVADPRQWMSGPSDLDEALSRIAEGPRFADLLDLERRYAKVVQAWAALRRRSLEHSSVMLEAWVKAGRQFADELQKLPKADGAGLDPKRALALWTDLANRILLQTQRSDRFLQTQREMIRASTELRVAQQDLVEHFGKQYGFPTRTELDDLHKSLTDMRRELRKLRRANETRPEATQAAPAQAAPAQAAPAQAAPAQAAPAQAEALAPPAPEPAAEAAEEPATAEHGDAKPKPQKRKGKS